VLRPTLRQRSVRRNVDSSLRLQLACRVGAGPARRGRSRRRTGAEGRAAHTPTSPPRACCHSAKHRRIGGSRARLPGWGRSVIRVARCNAAAPRLAAEPLSLFPSELGADVSVARGRGAAGDRGAAQRRGRGSAQADLIGPCSVDSM